MHIKLTMPPTYKGITIIKTENYPYSRMLISFMESVINLASREHLTGLSVFGRIENGLAAGKPLKLDSSEGSNVNLELRTDNESIIQFFSTMPTNNKQTALMFIRLLLRLQGVYGNSLAEMIYLVDTLPNTNVSNTNTNSTVSSIASVSILEPNSSPDIGKDVPDDVSNPTGIQIGNRKVHDTRSTDKTNTKAKNDNKSEHAIKTKNDTKAKNDTKSEHATKATNDIQSDTEMSDAATETSTLDEIMKKAESLKNDLKDVDAAKTGEVVTTNPLMGEFFDFNS